MSDTRVHCFFCDRRSIAVVKLTGWLAPHHVKAGRKGAQCEGADQPAGARPEERAA